jgi:hypothetical protein
MYGYCQTKCDVNLLPVFFFILLCLFHEKMPTIAISAKAEEIDTATITIVLELDPIKSLSIKLINF